MKISCQLWFALLFLLIPITYGYAQPKSPISAYIITDAPEPVSGVISRDTEYNLSRAIQFRPHAATQSEMHTKYPRIRSEQSGFFRCQRSPDV
jgi:hypothetical protein